jgi:hypothetical protein
MVTAQMQQRNLIVLRFAVWHYAIYKLSKERIIFLTGDATLVKIQNPIQCFSADSWLPMIDGRRLDISKLRTGNQLLTFDGSKLVIGEMILMLDHNSYSQGKLVSTFAMGSYIVA